MNDAAIELVAHYCVWARNSGLALPPKIFAEIFVDTMAKVMNFGELEPAARRAMVAELLPYAVDGLAERRN